MVQVTCTFASFIIGYSGVDRWVPWPGEATVNWGYATEMGDHPTVNSAYVTLKCLSDSN
ncbi:MAG: hypothetical protein ABGX20_21495 [Bacillus sp. (in: firmicutes)]